jgi:hypothetical protein
MSILEVASKKPKITFPNYRGQHAEKQRRRLAAQCAIGPSKVAAIKEYLDQLAPHRRIAALLALTRSESPQVFWPTFTNNWCGCDKGSTNKLLPEVLQRVGPAPASCYQQDWDKGNFFQSLPDQITVYRGASRQRIGGLSWTTSKIVAWGFAYGHRGIRVLDPVIATATINKTNILWATDQLSEREVLGVPRDIKIEAFPSEHSIAHMGWRLTDDILHNRHHGWYSKDFAFVGLRNVLPITIARAHFLAVEHIGYTPEAVRVGIKRTDTPIDTKYWSAVLAAVPAAKLERDGGSSAPGRNR